MVRRCLAATGVASLLVGIGVALGAPAVATNFGPSIPISPVSQQSAVRSAQAYLEMSGFSRQGLIEQLQYEGFSIADATFAVDSLEVDWNLQAARSAKAYLEMSGFSRSGLVSQLEYEGFTPPQAEYGASAVGL